MKSKDNTNPMDVNVNMRFPAELILGKFRFYRPAEEIKDEYKILLSYRFDENLSIRALNDVLDQIEQNYGTLISVHIYYADKDNRDPRLYHSLSAYHNDNRQDEDGCDYGRVLVHIDINGYNMSLDLYNWCYSAKPDFYARLNIIYIDPTRGGTRPDPRNRTDYYTSEGRLIRHDVKHDAFYVWDNTDHAWKRSTCAWHDYYGWDGWGDGICEFKKFDMDESTAAAYMESTKKYEEENREHQE